MTLPLSGYTILDLTHVLAGPYCTMTFSDMGAKVIKVEPPNGGDDTRTFPPFKDGKAKVEIALARGKEKQDKRQDLKESEAKREIQRALKVRNR